MIHYFNPFYTFIFSIHTPTFFFSHHSKLSPISRPHTTPHNITFLFFPFLSLTSAGPTLSHTHYSFTLSLTLFTSHTFHSLTCHFHTLSHIMSHLNSNFLFFQTNQRAKRKKRNKPINTRKPFSETHITPLTLKNPPSTPFIFFLARILCFHCQPTKTAVQNDFIV